MVTIQRKDISIVIVNSALPHMRHSVIDFPLLVDGMEVEARAGVITTN